MRSYSYPPELLAVLPSLGIAPRGDTPPRLVRDQLNDLYRYEIRRLRDRLLAKECPKADYSAHVITLRKKYWPLSLTPAQWEKLCTDDSPGVSK